MRRPRKNPTLPRRGPPRAGVPRFPPRVYKDVRKVNFRRKRRKNDQISVKKVPNEKKVTMRRAEPSLQTTWVKAPNDKAKQVFYKNSKELMGAGQLK